MASILNSKAKRFVYDSYENQEAKQQIQSEADIFIKRLSQRQRDTDLSLEKCLQNEKEFKLGHTFKPVTELSTGTLSYDDFKQLSTNLEESVGNSTEEDLKQTNKNISRHIRELALAVKPNSLETKLLQFAISCNAVGEIQTDTRPPDHPIHQLDKIENELFGHLSYGNNPQQAAKTILRKRKQLLESISEPIGPKNILEPVREESLWDVTDRVEVKKKCPEKVYLCKPEKLFTIREGAIVELNKNYVLDKPVKREDKLQTFICIDYKNQNDQIHSRLSEEEIKKIPKFQNYEKGMPSSVLYVKNLSVSVTEKDLVSVFSKYQEAGKPRIIYKLMQKGKMRGQAFIHFPCTKSSMKAMEDVNGVILHDKPVIIHYGRSNS